MDFFNDFGDLFPNLWNKFNRPVKDQFPYSLYKADNKGYIVVCNTLGIDKKDLSVNVVKEKGRSYPTLRVKGETDIENIGFHNMVDLAISLKLENPIDDVKYEVRNGLTLVYIKTKLPDEEPKIEATLLENDGSDSFDW